MQKIHTHWRHDILCLLLSISIASLYVWFWSAFFEEPPIQTIANLFTFENKDYIDILLLFIGHFSLIFGIILILNFGFRVFEYNEHGFCIRSMFSRRCYRWKDIEEIYASTKFGADWVIFSTSDGNFYYCPYNSQVLEILKIKTKKKVTTVYDPYTITPYLRKRRRRFKQKMMFFQP